MSKVITTTDAEIHALGSHILQVTHNEHSFLFCPKTETTKAKEHILSWAAGFMSGCGSDEPSILALRDELLHNFLMQLKDHGREYIDRHDLSDLNQRWEKFVTLP